MSTALQQAKRRMSVAVALFALGAANILLKLTGISELDTSIAPTLNAARGMRFGYYFAPLLFVVAGWLFWSSGKNKLLQAECEEKAESE